MPDQPDKKSLLLETVETIEVPGCQEPFEVRSHFERSPGVVYSTIWSEFKERFYAKVETPRAPSRIRKYRLLSISPDGPIISELGGEGKVETSVGAAHWLMTRQGRGSSGILQTNGFANIFYIRDLKGVLCAVRIGWDGDGWVIDAISVKDPLAWNGKHEIFCPVQAPEAP